jgi:uncharacterized protein YecT (DUF1311 family)
MTATAFFMDHPIWCGRRTPPLPEITDFYRQEAIGIEGEFPPPSDYRRVALNGLTFPRRIRHFAITTAGVAAHQTGANEEMGTMSDTVTLKLAAAISAGTLLALAAMATSVRPVAAQEFDCRNAEFASERAICGSDRLSALDERMSALYADLKTTAYGDRDERADLKTYQQQFLDARDACGRDVECIRGAYLDQISVLESRLERSYRRSER